MISNQVTFRKQSLQHPAKQAAIPHVPSFGLSINPDNNKRSKQSKPQTSFIDKINNIFVSISNKVTGFATNLKLRTQLSPELRRDYADLCKATNRKFNDPQAPIPKGYKHLQDITNTTSGYNASIFEDKKGTIVLVNEGTQMAQLKDVITNDGKILSGDTVPPQVFDALETFDMLTEKYGKPPVVIGHSLGGYLTQVIGGLRETPKAISYNGPGAQLTVEKLVQQGLQKGESPKIVNIIVDLDPIATLIGSDKNLNGVIDPKGAMFAKHVTGKKGEVYVLKGDPTKDAFGNHTLWDSLSAGKVIDAGDDLSRYTLAHRNALSKLHQTAFSLTGMAVTGAVSNAKQALPEIPSSFKDFLP